MQGASGLTFDALIRLEWQIALGEDTLTFAELEALAKLKTPLVKIRGQWVQVSAEEIQAAIELWKGKTAREVRLRELLPLSLGATPAAHGIEFAGVRAEGRIAELLAQLDGRAAFAELPAPARLNAQLLGTIVLDEARNIKNSQSKHATAARAL